MTNAWFLGATNSVGQTEDEARSTVEPLRTDNATVEMDGAPQFNEFDTDQSGELIGLSPRTVIGPTEDIEQYAPWWARLATAPHNEIVDRQVATSGTAAAREDRGEQGHGTMQFTESLEPVVRDGGAFGNEYFASPPTNIQQGMGAYMTPVDQDNWGTAVAQSRANKNSREAVQSTLYASFLKG